MNGLLPTMIPHFTVLQQRGLKRAYIAVYGAIVAFDAVQYVPTVTEIAQAAGLGVDKLGVSRGTKRVIAALVECKLVERVRYTSTMTRYRPLGPRLAQQPANDNASVFSEPVKLCRYCSTQGVCKACGLDMDAQALKPYALNAEG